MTVNLNRRSTRRLIAAGMIGILFSCAGGIKGYADPPINQRDVQVAIDDENEESIDVRYARAHLELAKLDLKRAEYWNQRIPNIISDRTLAFLRKHVEVDTEQLRQSQQSDYSDVHQVYVRGAKAALELAEAEVAKRQTSFKEVGGTYSALELDRAIAVLNVARLNLERMNLQRDPMQTIAFLQWQLEELRNQILELQIQVESTPER